MTLKRGDEEHKIKFGMGTHVIGTHPWQSMAKEKQFFGRFTLENEPDPWMRSDCGAAAVWVNEKTLVIKCHMTGLMQSFIITCHFGDEATVIHIAPMGTFKYDGLPVAMTHVNGDE